MPRRYRRSGRPPSAVVRSRFGGSSGMRVRRSGATALFAATALALPAAGDAPDVDRFDTVVIDAGHGGTDEGAKGPRGALEKQVVLDVAARLAARLRERGLRVVLT